MDKNLHQSGLRQRVLTALGVEHTTHFLHGWIGTENIQNQKPWVKDSKKNGSFFSMMHHWFFYANRLTIPGVDILGPVQIYFIGFFFWLLINISRNKGCRKFSVIFPYFLNMRLGRTLGQFWPLQKTSRQLSHLYKINIFFIVKGNTNSRIVLYCISSGRLLIQVPGRGERAL